MLAGSKEVLYLIYGQLSLFTGVIICILILPKGLIVNEGVSYYGVHSRTIIPFVTTFVISVWFIFLAAKNFSIQYPFWVIRDELYIDIVLMLVIMVTPFNDGRLVGDVHVLAGILLFSLQFILAIWLGLVIFRNYLNSILLFLLTITGLLSFYYNEIAHGYLIEGQLLFQLIFSIFLIRVLFQLNTQISSNIKILID